MEAAETHSEKSVRAARVREKVWLIESRTTPGIFYLVELEIPFCPCPHFRYHPSCWHLSTASAREAEEGDGKDG